MASLEALTIPKLVPMSISDLAADELRTRIIYGRIPTGAKLTEREVAQILGIGRMPAHDALMALEHEGLVINKSDGRYVVELTEAGVRSLYQARQPLERTAAELAALHTDPAQGEQLSQRLAELRVACEKQNAQLTTAADLALHREIWAQSDSPYVIRLLESLRSVIYVLVMQGSLYGERDWDGLYRGHAKVVDAINAGDSALAGQIIETQLTRAAAHSLRVIQIIQSQRPE